MLMIVNEKYKVVIQTYIKQRILIRMKYFNSNMISLNKVRKSRARLQSVPRMYNRTDVVGCSVVQKKTRMMKYF
ncbi:THAP domain-containing protein 1-like [Aphis craccivora]|uniref:THAP domain-containing protein 1-like n=1 Tax=Aphis craccivora TaxID=307492 RepID=A0A6G0XGW6_APHCR|nr:THAP domain-containing protein 1-like [Aphis craccivora]